MTVTLGRVVFRCPLFLLILYALIFTLLLNLGFWQLHRGDEKRALIAQQTQNVNAEPIRINNAIKAISDDFRYKKAIVRGIYDTTHQFLLDNQIVNGKVGYFVLTPFIVEGSYKTPKGAKAVLVNRGWVAANVDRRILPDVAIKTAQTTLHGRINHFPSVGIKLDGAGIPTPTSPAVIQLVDTTVLEKKLGYALFSHQLELDAAMPEGYVRQWMTTTLMPPERHFGYALQWFSLALTATGLFFWYSIKRIHD
jgi:surfeit locus 1 family protein